MSYVLIPTSINPKYDFPMTKQKQIKGQLISKANCQAEDSSKKQTNEFVFTSMRHVFVRFLEESSARKKRFEII